MQEVGKVKIELQQVMTKLDGERTIQKDLREKLSETDNKLSGEIKLAKCCELSFC